MQHKFLFSALTVLLGIFTFASLQAGGGRDSFKVYLNNKLIHEQYVGQEMQLDKLQLDESNLQDKLTFHYSHCGKIGTSRKLTVKDAAGKILREWKFTDAEGKQSGMAVPVKDLLALRQQNVSFFYTATELPKGQLMASFRLHSSATSWVPGQSVLALMC
ncbi:hypothetical protein [Chitinophaga deserti]|uniref:hypothetical protein n=1 Tax=Chitinophaga deserti TaxID=2164099 RepID=UPI001300290E|nr:hypothetical protein [Chitinophaga deserti]